MARRDQRPPVSRSTDSLAPITKPPTLRPGAFVLSAPINRPSAAARKLNTAFSHTPARGPALGDGLALGVEAHGVRAVGVQVAEQRTLPAAEGVVGHRHRQGTFTPTMPTWMWSVKCAPPRRRA